MAGGFSTRIFFMISNNDKITIIFYIQICFYSRFKQIKSLMKKKTFYVGYDSKNVE